MAINESVVLDTLELNPLPSVASPYSLDDIQFPTPRKRYEWVQGADADGAELVRDPLVDQRTIPGTLRVADTTRDAINQAIAAFVAKLEEAETQPDGIPLVWTPADATKQLTFYVLSGEIGDIPITHESGYFAGSVAVPFTLTCKPFGYGNEIAGSPVTASTPLVTTTVASVPGDVPAEARIIVTDAASQARRDVIWGLEQHDYNAASPASLLLAASSLVTSGFAGASTTLTGAYSSNVIQASLFGQPTAVCGTGNQPHIGTFRVRARVQATATVTRVRLAWQDGDGPFSANAWVSPPTPNALCEVDLGIITIAPATLGSQRWTGRIEAYTSDGSIQTLSINYLELIPAGEGYGRARGIYGHKPGSVVARDDLGGFTTGTLNGRTPQVGAAWVTAGDATDFNGFAGGGGEAQRSTTTDTIGRFGVLGSAMTDQEVQAIASPNLSVGYQGVVARYVDTNNHIRAFFTTAAQPTVGAFATITSFAINVVVAGSATAWVVPVSLPNAYYLPLVRLVVYASGAVHASLLNATVDPITLQVVSAVETATVAVPPGVAALAAGGALASGKAGIFDLGSTPTGAGSSRIYKDIAISTPAAEPIVAYANRQIEFRSASVLRQDASGTYMGRPPAYRGARALIPPAGDKNRTTRVAIAARRADTDVVADSGVTDSTTLQVNVTPRYLAVPH